MKTNEEYRLLEQQLVEREKQIVMLRETLKDANEYAMSQADYCPNEAQEALAATKDLSGLVLCDAEPVRYIYKVSCNFGEPFWVSELAYGREPIETLPLYKARKQP